MPKTELSGRFKEPRIKWTNDEYIYTLAYYYFIYQKNTRISDLMLFTNDLNKLTHTGRGYNSIKIRFSNYDAVNPQKESRGFKNTGKDCHRIWNECIDKQGNPREQFIEKFRLFIDKYASDREVYESFLMIYKNNSLINKDDAEKTFNSDDIEAGNVFEKPEYKPCMKPQLQNSSTTKYARNSHVSKKAIYNSNFTCDINPIHESFIAKNGKQYMEAHHLIPMGAQDSFEYSLDVDANIVCLCPNCHRKLHHGIDTEEELLHLFNQRKGHLEESGIKVTFEQLKEYYK